MPAKKPIFGPASLEREPAPTTQLVTRTLPKKKRCPVCLRRAGTVPVNIQVGIDFQVMICEPCSKAPLAEAALKYGPTVFEILKRFFL